MKKIDMMYGNPGFLQDLWEYRESMPINHLPSNMSYMVKDQTLPALSNIIKQLHKKHKNCHISTSSEVIVTSGAIQALQAALYAYRKTKHTTRLFMPAPYWGRFNDLARNSGLETVEINEDAISLITSPNNPDGHMNDNYSNVDIRDACYNWPQYTKPVKFTDDVVIFSLAKLSGHASTRIGWAIVNNPTIASLMLEYIELFGSGVSFDAQLRAYHVIADIMSTSFIDNKSFFRLSKDILDKRRVDIKQAIKDKDLLMNEISNQGMFWYGYVQNEFLAKLNVQYTPGQYFSGHDTDTHTLIRLNIGCQQAIFDQFILRLRTVK